MAKIVNRVFVTPNTYLRIPNAPFVLRVCLNNPNDRLKCNGIDIARPVQGVQNYPYLHPGKETCWEYDYSSPSVKQIFKETVDACAAMYAGNPNLIAVEGPGIGQWGEGSVWAYNAWRGTRGNQICPPEDQQYYMGVLLDAFQGIPVLCRYLVEPAHDKGSYGAGLEFTSNTYDDVFLGANSTVLGNQIVEYGCEDAFHGAEVEIPLQQKFVKDPQAFISACKQSNRKLAYMVRFCYQPVNKAEQDNLNAIYDYVTNAQK